MSRFKHLQADQPKIRPSHWILFFSLIGFGLRLQKLSFQPLWGDEGWSFYFAAQSLPQLLALTAVDIHPPLYYALLKVWLFIAGSGPEPARFLSVVFGTALIPVAGILGHRLFEVRVGAAAVAVVSVMPLAVYYSQEVRMYGLVTLLRGGHVRLLLHPDGQPEKVAGRLCGHDDRGHVHHVLCRLHPAVSTAVRPVDPPAGKPASAAPDYLFHADPFIAVGLLYLPWIMYAGPRLVSYIQNKRAVEGYLPLNLIRFLGDHFVAFSLGHLAPICRFTCGPPCRLLSWRAWASGPACKTGSPPAPRCLRFMPVSIWACPCWPVI